MSSEFPKELIEAKNRQRMAMRNEYLKKITNPYLQEAGGHLFDPAVQRVLSMKTTKIDFFRETPLTIMKGLGFVVIPLGLIIYHFKRSREQKEALFRSGKVAYKDRLFKFI